MIIIELKFSYLFLIQTLWQVFVFRDNYFLDKCKKNFNHAYIVIITGNDKY